MGDVVERWTPRPLTQGYVLSFTALTQWPQWSPDSSRIAYLSSMERGVKVAVVTVAGGKAVTIAPREDIFTFTSVNWSPDSRQIAISRMSQDFRRKELVVAGADGRPVREVWHDTDDKWVNHEVAASYDVAWASDSSRFAFLSNHDGWTHLYLADLNRGAPVQLTKGESTEFWCSWMPGDRSILTISSRGHLQQRLLWMVPTSGGGLQQLIPNTGITFPTLANHAEPVWSSDGRRLAYVFSGPDEPPGLWTLDVSGGSPVRIESGLPSGIDVAAVAHMEAVEFKSVADGARVPGVLITSKNLRRNMRNPALIFTYGGYLQMATLGWGLGAKSRFFNYLANKGYVVLIVDPRGSEGYGDWYAKELYKGAGGKQVDDLVAGARYLANLSYVDPKGIGIFGHSYSGYLAFQTLVQAPPDTFAAGIILAGFFDWMREEGFGTRYQVYTRIRVGTDDETPNLLYERSPANFLEKLKAPVLLVHGSRDTNVPIVETEYLVRRMLKADKEFDYMVYPGEPHGLVQPESERDFCRRVERYLDRYLRHQEKTPNP